MNSSQAAKQAFENLLFDVRRSIRYHMRKQRRFDIWNDLFTFLALAAGGATVVVRAADKEAFAVLVLASLVVLFNALSLTLAFGRKARLYNYLARRFVALERTMTRKDADKVSAEDVATLVAERLEIEADEPPINRILDILCYNELVVATSGSTSGTYSIPAWKRFLALFEIDTYDPITDNIRAESTSPAADSSGSA